MRTRFLVVPALLLASAGCASILGIGSDATLELPLPSDHRYSYNSFDDLHGLAGLRVTLSGAVERTFAAEDFPVEPFSVPEEGRVFVEVSLSGGPGTPDPIARGRVDWVLEENMDWILRFDRAPWPPISSLPVPPGETEVPCSWPGCKAYWRFDIAPRARHYEEEALWLALWGYDSTKCKDDDVFCD